MKNNDSNQKEVLYSRYIENSSYYDRLSLYFGALGIISKGLIYFSCIGGFALSIVLLNPFIIAVSALSIFVLVGIHIQSNTLQQRFEILTEDLGRSEEQLHQTVGLNRDLESQLNIAFRNNYEIQKDLEQKKFEMQAILKNVQEKEQEALLAHKKIGELGQEVAGLRAELQENKKIFYPKVKGFFDLLDETAALLKPSLPEGHELRA